ncbi:uncharacterized protein J7T55_012972 [Diaporthe amygdali]|uniref:uncharacterized protein n=1 Tax=Phomopsis amygdali TaxID=1214568 RepID=UPI0022FE0A53|nr:uncharacterized protein J7T55_012972 [Diaporthe amygdali]KAJ0118718.1 uncharacterized protein J7T55_012972 [Diaporthe amygdali]
MIEKSAHVPAVPFPQEAELVEWDLVCKDPPAGLDESLPCVFIDPDTDELLLTSRHMTLFLRKDLDFSRLNEAYPYLWWSGRQGPARSLQRQVSSLGRTVCSTERADLHLVWCPTTARLFLRPLPAYILSHAFWTAYLLPDQDLAASARGLLLSYVWLLRSEQDWRIARQNHLLPPEVSWPKWRSLVEAMLDIRQSGCIDVNSLAGVHRRFHYGGLRLNRLDHILRFMPPHRVGDLLWGYGGVRHPTYSDFFQRRFRWIVLAFAFCTTVLSALQVALATDILSTSAAYCGVNMEDYVSRYEISAAVFWYLLPVRERNPELDICFASLLVSTMRIHYQD